MLNLYSVKFDTNKYGSNNLEKITVFFNYKLI